MKLTINKKAFSGALATVDRVVESRSTVPILSNVRLDAQEGLTITGTNLDVEMCVQIPANVELAGAITVPSVLITKLARSLPANGSGDLVLEMSENGHDVQIHTARSQYTLPALPAGDFPSMEGPQEKPVEMTMKGSALAALFQRVSHSICTEETRYYLCGIYLHVEDDGDELRMIAVATQGTHLARTSIPAPDGATADMPGIIVHDRTARCIIQWLDGYADDITFRVDSHKLEVEAGPNRLTAKLVDGTYPDYQNIMPRNNEICIDIDAQAVADAITRTKTLDTGKTSAALVMELSADTLCFSAKSEQEAAAIEELPVDYTGDDFRMGFTISLADTVFSAVPGKAAKLYLGTAGSPALIIPHDEPSTAFVLMGRRV